MATTYDTIIIGAGLSGLATAHFLQKSRPEASFLILEKENRPGGAVLSFHEQGFLAEWGPHGFLNNTAESLEILNDTGLMAKAQLAPLGNFVRFVCHKGRLMQLPQNPKQLLSTHLLSLPAKLRLLGDLFIKPMEDDQTISQWAARRFGKGILHLVDAAATGTFAGDFTRLSIDAVMPGLRDMEKSSGSVLRALKKRKKDKSSGRSSLELPAMVSFPGGMEDLIKTLQMNKPIRFGSKVNAVIKTKVGWDVEMPEDRFHCANLVIALPVNQALSLLASHAKPPVAEVPTAAINNVVMGFTDKAKIPFGFGYLAPEVEKRFTMGVMFSSHMFPGRCPAGTVLIEALVGGRRHPERLDLSDEELCRLVFDDISQLIELPEKPFFTRVLRPKAAIPQLEMDHPALLAWRRQLCADNNGLFVCGFGWDGIGMNEMVKSAKKAVNDLQEGAASAGKAELKPVYF
ncbi:MAG: protoporphyrinogen oxidase [Deltaproteobacteria bacterium]